MYLLQSITCVHMHVMMFVFPMIHVCWQQPWGVHNLSTLLVQCNTPKHLKLVLHVRRPASLAVWICWWYAGNSLVVYAHTLTSTIKLQYDCSHTGQHVGNYFWSATIFLSSLKCLPEWQTGLAIAVFTGGTLLSIWQQSQTTFLVLHVSWIELTSTKYYTSSNQDCARDM